MLRLPSPVFAPDAPPSAPDAAGVAPVAPAAPSLLAPGGGDPPAPVGGAPKIPDGLPPQFWDSQANKINEGELIKAYGEAAAFKTQHDERVKALPKTAEEYKIELKLPDTVKLPDGLELKIDDKDPRVPAVRAFALKHQLPQDAVNELVALHAQSEIEAHHAAEAAIQAEMKKLGENGKVRVQAAEDFLKANLSKDEHEAVRPFIGNAAAFAALEKLIAKSLTQQVPGNQIGGQPPKTAELPMERRWYTNGAPA